MEKAIEKLFVGLLLTCLVNLLSCDFNETCRDKSFQDHTWQATTPALYNNLHFREDDTLAYDIPNLGFYGLKGTYKFDQDCNGFDFIMLPYFDTTLHFSITNNTGNEMWIKNGSNEYHYQKQ